MAAARHSRLLLAMALFRSRIGGCGRPGHAVHHSRRARAPRSHPPRRPAPSDGSIAANSHAPVVTGYVKRSDGHNTVWIDGSPVAVGRSGAALLEPRAVDQPVPAEGCNASREQASPLASSEVPERRKAFPECAGRHRALSMPHGKTFAPARHAAHHRGNTAPRVHRRHIRIATRARGGLGTARPHHGPGAGAGARGADRLRRGSPDQCGCRSRVSSLS